MDERPMRIEFDEAKQVETIKAERWLDVDGAADVFASATLTAEGDRQDQQ